MPHPLARPLLALYAISRVHTGTPLFKRFPLGTCCLFCLYHHLRSIKKWSKSYEESLAELHWSTIEQRHSYLSLCQIYKIVNRLDCINFTDYFSPCKAPQTRYCKANSLQCMPSRVNVYRYSFFINAPFIWNSLPVHISSAPTYAAFKSSLLSFRSVP